MSFRQLHFCVFFSGACQDCHAKMRLYLDVRHHVGLGTQDRLRDNISFVLFQTKKTDIMIRYLGILTSPCQILIRVLSIKILRDVTDIMNRSLYRSIVTEQNIAKQNKRYFKLNNP